MRENLRRWLAEEVPLALTAADRDATLSLVCCDSAAQEARGIAELLRHSAYVYKTKSLVRVSETGLLRRLPHELRIFSMKGQIPLRWSCTPFGLLVHHLFAITRYNTLESWWQLSKHPFLHGRLAFADASEKLLFRNSLFAPQQRLEEVWEKLPEQHSIRVFKKRSTELRARLTQLLDQESHSLSTWLTNLLEAMEPLVPEQSLCQWHTFKHVLTHTIASNISCTYEEFQHIVYHTMHTHVVSAACDEAHITIEPLTTFTPRNESHWIVSLGDTTHVSIADLTDCLGYAPHITLTFRLPQKGMLTPLLLKLKHLVELHPSEAPSTIMEEISSNPSLRACQPKPTPPLWAFPRKASLSHIALWRKDPYAFYLRCILNLEPFESLWLVYGKRLWGQVVHDFMQRSVGQEVKDSATRIEDFSATLTFPLPFLWKERLMNLASWVKSSYESAQPPPLSLPEVSGCKHIFLEGFGYFTLVARADRLDIFESEKKIAIIEYKTGAIPPWSQIEKGLSPQLGLLAWILESGGFDHALKSSSYELDNVIFWDLSKNDSRPYPRNVAQLIASYDEEFLKWLKDNLQEGTCFSASSEPSPYTLLSRAMEWSEGLSMASESP